jgi:hypothetical protein
MRKVLSAAGLTALTALAFASAPVASASAGTFTGTCKLTGVAVFAPPIGLVPMSRWFDFEGSGTCAGVDGTTPYEGPASATASGSGSLSCYAGTGSGSGTLTLGNGDSVGFNLTLVWKGTEVDLALTGKTSGTGHVHASFAADTVPFADDCPSGSVQSANFAATATAASLSDSDPSLVHVNPGLSKMAYDFMLSGSNNTGTAQWINPEPYSVASTVFDSVPAGNRPKFLRVGQPLNVVSGSYENGDPGPFVEPLFEKLKYQYAMKLGASLSAAVKGTNTPRPVQDLIDQGYAILSLHDSQGNPLYQWLFVDHSGDLTHAQQVRVVQGLESEGWRRVMTNDTQFDPTDANSPVPPHDASSNGPAEWGHAQEFGLIDEGPNSGDQNYTKPCDPSHFASSPQWCQDAINAANTATPNDALVGADTRFIIWVHTNDPTSHPVMKLEASSETSRLAQLPLYAQCQLLDDWSKLQRIYNYRFLYPMFIPPETGNGFLAYDSLYRGTNNSDAACSNVSSGDSNLMRGGSTNTFEWQTNLLGGPQN